MFYYLVFSKTADDANLVLKSCLSLSPVSIYIIIVTVSNYLRTNKFF